MLPNPDLKRIIIETTNRCNLDCSMCLRRTWNSALGSMSPEVFSRFMADLRELPSTPEIFFGGYGEPLSHPNILEMISQVAAAGSRPTLITNGTLLTPQLVDDLVQAGLQKLWISADSSHQDAIQGSQINKTQPDLLESITEIQNQTNGSFNKLDPGLAAVITKNNQAEILGLFQQGCKLGISSYFLTNLEAFSTAQTEELPYTTAQLRQPGSWRNSTAAFFEKLEELRENHPGISISGVLGQEQDRCPFAERGDLVLRWDGEISPCLPLLYDRETYLGSWEHQQYAYSLGNIKDHSFTEIWACLDYSQLRERLLNEDFSPCLGCRDCWLSDDNLQDCMGFEHPTCGGCLWAAGLVNCP